MQFRKFFCALMAALAATTIYGGTWTPLAHPSPGTVNLMLLLSDGTVMAANAGGSSWFRLTPDIHGSYANGTWTSLNPMHDARLYFSSVVLTNGNVFVAGGEFGTGGSKSEVYDSVKGTWTAIPVPTGILTGSGFEDAVCDILPDGNVLMAPNDPATNGNTALFITASNTWSVGPKLFRGNSQEERSWVKLPDDSLLTAESFGSTGLTNSERYIPALKQWVNDSNLPLPIGALNDGEQGGALLLPDGHAIFLGGNGNTAIYTPTGNTTPGTWTAGPVIPGGYGIQDGPAAMMVNGKILCLAGNPTNYNAPAYFFEYDSAANSFTQINGPTGLSDDIPPYEAILLDLPDGTVLYSHFGRDLYIYQPDGPPLVAGKPAISNIVANVDGSFTLTGTGLNGISEGATYGDDAQMNSNYPLVRLTNSVGNVYYERTYNWNSTSVMSGNRLAITRFTNSAALPPGNYSLTVVANGISSDLLNFVLPPPLELKILPSDGYVILTWPTNPPGFSLEYTTNLASAIWSTDSVPPILANGVYGTTEPITNAQMFFRLGR
jgi:hypothetical protein